MNKKTNQELSQELTKRIETNQISIEPKYWPKECWSCDWNKEKGINALCDFHFEYSYERILQNIEGERRDRNKWRMIFGVIAFCLFSFIVFVLGMFLKYPTSELKNFTFIFHLFGQSIVYLSIVIWLLWRNEKDTQKWLGEYEKDKAKWIRN